MIDRDWALDARAVVQASVGKYSGNEVIKAALQIADALMAARLERGGFNDSPDAMLDKIMAMKPAIMKEIQIFLAELETMRNPGPLS